MAGLSERWWACRTSVATARLSDAAAFATDQRKRELREDELRLHLLLLAGSPGGRGSSGCG